MSNRPPQQTADMLKKNNKLKRSDGAKVRQLPNCEWNYFGLCEDELVACCYWEYARESNAIRDAVKIAKTAFANLGKAAPETAERQAFREATNRAYGLLHQTGYELRFLGRITLSRNAVATH